METAKELVAGTVGGCVGIVVGQPLDTIKVRMQSLDTPTYRSSWHCLRSTVTEEGFRALYKGMSSPLIGNGPINAILFASYNTALRVQGAGEVISGRQAFFAGCASGLAQCLVTSPTELIKCQLQVRRDARGVKSPSPLGVLKALLAAEGPTAPLRGMTATVTRDVVPFGLYFWSYETAKQRLEAAVPAGAATSAVPTLVAGGVAGMLTWAVAFPMDVVRSSVMTAPPGTPRAQLKIAVRARAVYAAHGWRGFTFGLAPCLLRAFPVNAVTFYVYEWTLRLLNSVGR